MEHTTFTQRSALALTAGGAGLVIAGAVVAAGVQPMTSVSEDVWSYPWTSGTFAPISLLWAVLEGLVIFGLLGVARARIAVAGTALLLVAQLAGIPFADAATDATSSIVLAGVFSLGTLVSAIGFIVAARAAHGGRRTLLFLTGGWMVVMLALPPLNAIGIGVAGYGICLLAISATLSAPALRGAPA